MSYVAQQQKVKAEGFVSEAQAALGKKGWFVSKEKQAEEAAELYDKAGNAYKAGGFLDEAGDAFQKAGNIFREELKEAFQASKSLENAASCFRKANPEKAVEAYQTAMMMQMEQGRLLAAAKLAEKLAEMYISEEMEKDGKSTELLAIEQYKQAADLFDSEDSTSKALSCREKVADLYAIEMDPPNYMEAKQIYAQLAETCLGMNLMKYHAKGHFCKAILCDLAQGDMVAASKQLRQATGLDYTFLQSREGKFVQDLMKSVEEYDPQAFATACTDFNKITKLTPWQTQILLQIKKIMDEEHGTGEGDEVDLR